ncbi:MAG: hypothetical protein JWO20_431 [Candidatus Angelobacter sp.]|jgi:hypothetical protein|nr:hypothetical protein [Candidatus Angelobacter sp.]
MVSTSSPPLPEQIAKASRYLTETRDALVDSATTLSPSQWDFKPAPDRWSIAEIIEHVVLIEGRVHTIVGKMDEAPLCDPDCNLAQIEDFILAEVPQRSTKLQAPPHVSPTRRWAGPEALAHFSESREKTIQLLATSVLRGHVVPHPIFGPWDGYQWLLAAAAHSSRHTDEIREVKADSNYPRTFLAMPE